MIKEVFEDEFLKEKAIQVSIFYVSAECSHL